MDRLPLARLLAAATRTAIDELHAELARQGHPDVRPAYGYALVAVGQEGITAARLADVLGMTRQGAAKLVRSLAALGYVDVVDDAADRRARRLVLTARGRDLLARAARIQATIERRWERHAGASGMREALEAVLARSHGDGPVPLRPVW